MKLKNIVYGLLCVVSAGMLRADIGSDLLNAVTNNDEGETRRLVTNRELTLPYLRQSLNTAIDKNNVRIVEIILNEWSSEFSTDDLRGALQKAQDLYGGGPIVQVLLKQVSERSAMRSR